MVGSGVAVARRPVRVRLTRRGRTVVLALFLVVDIVAGVLLATASRAAVASSAPVPGGGSAVVRDADTLWAIAGRHAPSRPTWEVVAEIRELNGLADPTVFPGQVLALPAGR
jgi:hypothetical protein